MKRSFVFFYCWSLTHPSCQEFTLAKLKAEVLNGYVVMLEGFGFAQKYDEAVGMAALITELCYVSDLYAPLTFL